MYITYSGAHKMAGFWRDQILSEVSCDYDTRLPIKESEIKKYKEASKIAKEKVTADMIDDFYKTLVAIIFVENATKLVTTFNSDNTNSIIANIARAAGISLKCFPWFSETYMTDDFKVYGKIGFHGEPVEL